MKKIRYIILGLIMTMSFTACQDWLSVLPDNEQVTDQFWNTKEEVEGVLANGYICLRNCMAEMLIHSEARGNGLSVFASPSGDNSIKNIARADILPTNGYASWANFYKVINMANSLIKYAPGVVDNDDSFHENVMISWLSEAYYLRALSYFYLIRIFKDVPYITEPYVNDDADYDFPKSTEYEIMDYLLADLYANLEVAKEFFPETDPEIQMNSKGRATRWAIYALIADIHLWRGDYQECLDACNEIINSKRIGLIQAPLDQPERQLSVWFENFSPGNSNESIYEIQYDYGLSQRNTTFLDWFTSVTPRYMYSEYTYERLQELSELDKRAAFYLMSGNQVAKNMYSDVTGKIRSAGTNDDDQNYIIYRLADIYLMKAEAYIMMGNVDAAETEINAIRERVGVTSVTMPAGEKEMLKLLLSERHIEFLGEGKNWFDILRVAKRDKFRHHDILIDEIMNSDYGLIAPGVLTSKLRDTFALYMPISDSELQRNKLLVQNPYYQGLGK